MRTYQPDAATVAYLTSWLTKRAKYHTDKGRIFNLTISDFMDLWGDNRLKNLEKWIASGMNDDRMHNDNPYAFVLSWQSYAALQTGIMDVTTGKVMTRGQSKLTIKMGKGDRHSPEARKAIGQAKRGKEQAPDHVAKRAAAQRGVKRGPRPQAVIDAIKATKAAKRASQAGAAAQQ